MLFAALVLVVGVGAIVYILARIAGRGTAKQARAKAAADLAVPWSVETVSAQHETRVLVRRVTPEGAVLDEHEVARIPDVDEDWAAKVAEARAQAAMRAEMLNSEP